MSIFLSEYIFVKLHAVRIVTCKPEKHGIEIYLNQWKALHKSTEVPLIAES